MIVNSVKTYCGSEEGFTLMELMVVVALMSIVVLGMFSVTALSQTVFYNTGTYGQLTTDGMQTLRSLSREIGQTSPNLNPSHLNITPDASGNSVICFQIPVDWDNDGDVVTDAANPAVEWGAYAAPGQTRNGVLNGWTCYSVAQSQLIRRVTDAAATQVSNTVLTNNVQSFLVQQVNTDRLRMTLTSLRGDTRGQRGTRNFTSTFSSTTLLRNAVN